MSAKWVRSQQWDDRNFPSWAWPAKFVLRAFSSIWLSVLLLSGVAVYGTLASVPLGMLAGIPTWLFYLATLAVTIGVVSALPTWLLARTLSKRGVARGNRFIAGLVLFLGTMALAWTLWYTLVWPGMHYDEVTGSGLRFFSEFCERYKRTMVRQLPGMEMSELEFYAWWPLKVLLLSFVANLTTATLRRIEFRFMNVGVLTVHSGIITIAIGSVYYGALKQEGDMILHAGKPEEASGKPTVGPAATGFFFNPELADPALWVRQQGKTSADEWEQRTIRGLPRYQDYHLDAAGVTIGGDFRRSSDGGRDLSIPLTRPSSRIAVDEDIKFRIVGYSCYGETRDTWVDASRIGGTTVLRHVELIGPQGPVGDFHLTPGLPADRGATLERFLSVEYLEDPKPEYWQTLLTKLPEIPGAPDNAKGARHGLIIEIPAGAGQPAIRSTIAIQPQQTYEVGGGWKLTVKELDPEPPFSIITPGYEGASCSVAIVRVDPPAKEGKPQPGFDRYIYSRFPELNQDLLDEKNASGMPRRRPADGAIKLTYVDASMVTVAIAAGKDGAPPYKALWRTPGKDATLIENLKDDATVSIGPMISLKLGDRVKGAEKIDAPWPVPDQQRDRDLLRTRRSSHVAVEVTLADKTTGIAKWSTVLWVPNNPWHPIEKSEELYKTVPLPDGRVVQVAYGRKYQPFPGFQVALADFEMTPYPHTMTPKDYRSDLRVTRVIAGTDPHADVQSTSMNNPLLLRVPFQANPDAPTFANAAAWLVSWIAPTQYKLSQNSWDRDGWEQSKAMADRGEMPRAYARYTIIGVGNNPGIYIIAAGGVMMALGIPWAFYVKPWLLRREKSRLQALVASGQIKPGQSVAKSPPQPVVVTNGHPAGKTPARSEP